MQRNLNKITPIVLDYFTALDLDNCMVHDTIEKPLLTGPLWEFVNSSNMPAVTTLSSLSSVPVLLLSSVYFGYVWLLAAIQGYCQIPENYWLDRDVKMLWLPAISFSLCFTSIKSVKYWLLFSPLISSKTLWKFYWQSRDVCFQTGQSLWHFKANILKVLSRMLLTA